LRGAVLLAITVWLTSASAAAQSPDSLPAAHPIQQSQSSDNDSQSREPAQRELTILAGTPLEIDSTYTVSSRDVRKGDFISFRVLVPVKVEGVTVIEENALVTARVVKAKRGGHWGKAGKLIWTMQDVVAIDLARVPLTFHKELGGQQEINGTSHGGQVATTAIVFGALLFPASPLALLSGFRRGEDAILPEGHRFIVYVQKDTKLIARDKQK
jgi:hypothetical protein